MKVTDNSSAVSGYFEPELLYTLLPGCRECGGSHPLARKPALPADTCPDCGAAAVAPGETHSEKAVITGSTPAGLIAKMCFGIAHKLNNLSKRI